MIRVIGITLVLLASLVYKSSAQEAKMNANQTQVKQRNIMIPNAFTPNGDGVNDVFKLINVSGEQLLELKIFNRWGTIVYSSTDAGEGWDGRYKNAEQPVGVYGYGIRIKYNDGVIETYRGTITLIR
ncbi:hypothetical protein DBR32_08305 [Taibaiella sp. KBW10]|uniref:gliding motility-associated C-terminal domain-containing protein n=1 Tax=Taibaiella sp. KBW10 TaxID=2153357 RepID=UPI000F5AF5FF|nr:gliding motility-associated C-terminal domain-containing protein [Taibaiella sp. KBW10]RQO30722.1 hypothetical protein DBR32_08305 [Taibaiella sp. KBW10]